MWVIFVFVELGEGDKVCDLFVLFNLINYGNILVGIECYKVEFYVVVVDVYFVVFYVGCGGWMWYIGLVGWMYCVGIEGILGIW